MIKKIEGAETIWLATIAINDATAGIDRFTWTWDIHFPSMEPIKLVGIYCRTNVVDLAAGEYLDITGSFFSIAPVNTPPNFWAPDVQTIATTGGATDITNQVGLAIDPNMSRQFNFDPGLLIDPSQNYRVSGDLFFTAAGASGAYMTCNLLFRTRQDPTNLVQA